MKDKKKIDRRVMYTKMILRESLLELMKEKPIAKITPTELCRHAKMNRNTFYTHFDSPEMLLESIQSEFYDKIKHYIEQSLKVDSIYTLLVELCQVIYENRDFCTIIFSEHGDKDFLRKVMDLAYHKAIAEWQAVGMRDEGKKIEMLYCFFANGSVAIIQKWIQEGMTTSPNEIALFIVKASTLTLQAFLK